VKFKVSLSEKHADIIPEGAYEGLWIYQYRELLFQEAKDVTMNHLEILKKKIDNLIEYIGEMTEESCILSSKERRF